MKTIAIVTLLACSSHGVRADDQATPSPTPVYLTHLAQPASARRQEQIDRQRARQVEAESSAETRAQAKANRRATAATRAQTKAEARTRERAQRQVDAEARFEAAKETPHATSDLMKRMGFSEQEIAAQKANEAPAKPGAKEAAVATSQAGQQPEPPPPAANPGSAAGHPTFSRTEANGPAPAKPTEASPAPGSGSR